MTDQSLTFEFGEDSQRFFDRAFHWSHHSSNAEVDDIKNVELEIPEVVMNGIDQFLARTSMRPRFIRSTTSAYLSNNHQVIRIGMKSPLDDLIGHMRTVIIASIDVVYAGRDRLPQNSDCAINVSWRSPHLWAGKFHRTVAHAIQGDRCIRKREGASESGLSRHLYLLLI